MKHTARKPMTVGEILIEEFMQPLGISSKQLAEAMQVHRNTISALKNGGALTAPIAIKLAAAFGNSPEFWLNIQHAVDVWESRHRFAEASKDVTCLVPPGALNTAG